MGAVVTWESVYQSSLADARILKSLARVTVNTIEFKGPFGFDGPNSIFHELRDGVNGVYLWCVKMGNSRYRVYYVGEAADVKSRMSQHKKNFLAGKYSGHCLESLVNENVRVLMHSPHEGMIPRFSHIDRESFIEGLMANMHLFYASLHGEGVTAAFFPST